MIRDQPSRRRWQVVIVTTDNDADPLGRALADGWEPFGTWQESVVAPIRPMTFMALRRECPTGLDKSGLIDWRDLAAYPA